MNLTISEQQLYDYIKSNKSAEQYEIAKALGVCRLTITRLFKRLQDKDVKVFRDTIYTSQYIYKIYYYIK